MWNVGFWESLFWLRHIWCSFMNGFSYRSLLAIPSVGCPVLFSKQVQYLKRVLLKTSKNDCIETTWDATINNGYQSLSPPSCNRYEEQQQMLSYVFSKCCRVTNNHLTHPPFYNIKKVRILKGPSFADYEKKICKARSGIVFLLPWRVDWWHLSYTNPNSITLSWCETVSSLFLEPTRWMCVFLMALLHSIPGRTTTHCMLE